MRPEELNEAELEVLRELAPSYSDAPAEWFRPLDVGGSSRSHHSRTLARLVSLGLAEEKQRSERGPRGSKLYRVTPRGIDALVALYGPRMTRAEFDAQFRERVAAIKARKAARTATTSSA